MLEGVSLSLSPSSSCGDVLLLELILQVYCNLPNLKIHCVGFEGCGFFYPKGFSMVIIVL